MPRVLGLQLDIRWEDRRANHAAVDRLLDGRSIEPGTLIVLPEMFDVGFTMDATVANDHTEGVTRSYLAGLARRTGSTVVAGYVVNNEGGRAINHASVVGPDGREQAQYVKRQPFTPSGEREIYTAGTAPAVVEWQGLRIAPLICYDLRFPELFRDAVRAGAEAFVVIANWPIARVEHWVTLCRARAIENQAYVIAVNRCGRDPRYVYPGRSLVVDPKGEILTDAGDAEGVIEATVDPALVRSWRADFPALVDAGLLRR